MRSDAQTFGRHCLLIWDGVADVLKTSQDRDLDMPERFSPSSPQRRFVRVMGRHESSGVSWSASPRRLERCRSGGTRLTHNDMRLSCTVLRRGIRCACALQLVLGRAGQKGLSSPFEGQGFCLNTHTGFPNPSKDAVSLIS